jgi:hypothetical protein
MTDNPYDEIIERNIEEDRRQSLLDGAEEAENERRQMRKTRKPSCPEMLYEIGECDD